MSMSLEIWKSLDEDVRNNLTKKYLHSLNIVNNLTIFDEDGQKKLNEHTKIVSELESCFGKDNICPKQCIKTWSDLKKIDKRLNPHCGNPLITIIDKNQYLQNMIAMKNKCAIKIAKLIDEFYGGVITEDEWKDQWRMKYCVGIHNGHIKIYGSYVENTLIAFHTDEARDEFLEHKENRILIYNYFMCCDTNEGN